MSVASFINETYVRQLLGATSLFYYIPKSTLSAITIASVINLTSVPEYKKMIKEKHFYSFTVAICTFFGTFASVIIGICVGVCVATVIAFVRFHKEAIRVKVVEDMEKKVIPDSVEPEEQPQERQCRVIQVSFPSFLNRWNIQRVEASLAKMKLIDIVPNAIIKNEPAKTYLTLESTHSIDVTQPQTVYALDFKNTLYNRRIGRDLTYQILKTSSHPVYFLNMSRGGRKRLTAHYRGQVYPTDQPSSDRQVQGEHTTQKPLFFESIHDIIQCVLNSDNSNI